MNLEEIYPYKYETHMHTKVSSACSSNTPYEMVHAYKDAGYTGIIITDHHFRGNTAIDRKLDWENWVEEYAKSYELAKEEGDKIGLQVFFGWESNFKGTEFLIYGPDKRWMKNHPELPYITVEEQYLLINQAGGIVVHAHPFREAPYLTEIRLYPDYIDAVEGINTSHDNAFNEKAIEYARQHNLPITCGSDQHTVNLRKSGICFKTPVKNIKDFTDRILKNDFCIFNGQEYIKL